MMNKNLTRMVISYEIYETRCRLVSLISYKMTNRVRSSIYFMLDFRNLIEFGFTLNRTFIKKMINKKKIDHCTYGCQTESDQELWGTYVDDSFLFSEQSSYSRLEAIDAMKSALKSALELALESALEFSLESVYFHDLFIALNRTHTLARETSIHKFLCGPPEIVDDSFLFSEQSSYSRLEAIDAMKFALMSALKSALKSALASALESALEFSLESVYVLALIIAQNQTHTLARDTIIHKFLCGPPEIVNDSFLFSEQSSYSRLEAIDAMKSALMSALMSALEFALESALDFSLGYVYVLALIIAQNQTHTLARETIIHKFFCGPPEILVLNILEEMKLTPRSNEMPKFKPEALLVLSH